MKNHLQTMAPTRRPLGFAGAFLVASLLCSAAFAANHSVIMKSISFDPKVLQISTGDSVEWTNQSFTQHSADFETATNFNTGFVDPKKSSKKITFDQPGRFAYHCKVHGKTMSGEIVVSAPAAQR